MIDSECIFEHTSQGRIWEGLSILHEQFESKKPEFIYSKFHDK